MHTTGKSTKTESKLVLPRAGVGGGVGVKENKGLGEVMAERFLLGIMKMFKIDCDDGCTTLNIRKATELYT